MPLRGQAGTRTRPSRSARCTSVLGTVSRRATSSSEITTTSTGTASGGRASRRRTISLSLLSTCCSITRKSRSLSSCASPRRDPKSSTRAGEHAAAANRRPASMITASLIIRPTVPDDVPVSASCLPIRSVYLTDGEIGTTCEPRWQIWTGWFRFCWSQLVGKFGGERLKPSAGRLNRPDRCRPMLMRTYVRTRERFPSAGRERQY